MDPVGAGRAVVVVASDRVSAGTAEDRSGAAAVAALAELGIEADLVIVPDEAEEIAGLLRRFADEGRPLIVTSGGTGFGPRDVTPEATSAVLEREAPGIAEAIRADAPPPYGMLGRGVAGVRGRTLIVNLPGSTGGVKDGIAVVATALPHVLALLRGDAGHHPEPGS